MRRELNLPKKEVHFDGTISKIGYSLLPSLQSILNDGKPTWRPKVMNDMFKPSFYLKIFKNITIFKIIH